MPAPRGDRVRIVCQTAVGLVIAWLVLRTWLIEGLVVPMRVSGGSMAETLRGPLLEITCPQCGWQYACDVEEPPRGGLARCPNCGLRSSVGDVGSLPVRLGDRLLVDRSAFALRLPRRWEVVVLRCPENASEYCIKRVVGLPGETVEIRQGDVYINGQIAQKDLAQIQATSQLVYDAAFPAARSVNGTGSADRASAWQAKQAASHWRADADRPGSFVCASPEPDTAGPPGIDWLVYHHRGGEPVHDDHGYNQGVSRRLVEVADLRLTCRMQATGSGMLLLRIDDLGASYQLALDPAAGTIELTRNERTVCREPCDLRPLAGGVELDLSLFDRQLLLALDGKVCFSQACPSGEDSDKPFPQPLAIGALGMAVEVSELKVWRDIHYAPPGPTQGVWGVERPLTLADDELFVLGDNSPVSRDSRTLAIGAVPVNLLIGKPLGVK